MVPQFHPFVETCPSTMDLSCLLSQLHEPCWWCRASLSPCQPSPWSAMTWWMFCPIVYRNNFTFDLRKVRFFFSSSCNQVWYNHINSDKVVNTLSPRSNCIFIPVQFSRRGQVQELENSSKCSRRGMGCRAGSTDASAGWDAESLGYVRGRKEKQEIMYGITLWLSLS